MEVIGTRRDRMDSKFDCGLTVSKYTLLLLNVVFAISSVFMMSGGISAYHIFKTIYSDMGDAFRMLSIFWLIVGIILMFVSLFGILVAFKENVCLANFFGIAMMVVFLSQISVTIADFTLTSRASYMVSDQLEQMIRYYNSQFFDYRQKMDWIQSKYECCGNDGPSDWYNIDVLWDEAIFASPRSGSDFMPASCCVQYTNYVNMTCEQYHRSGCFEPIHRIVSESVMTIGSSALAYSILEVLGVLLAFSYARTIRRKKTQRDVHVWNSGQEYSPMPHRLTTNYLH